jgi:hypothetical protein
MGALKVSLIGLLVAAALAVSVALVIRNLPDGDQPAPPVKEVARTPVPAPAPAAPSRAKSDPALTVDQSRIPQAEDRVPQLDERVAQAEERAPPAAAQAEPQPEPAPSPAPFSTMQGRATELLAIPPAGVLGGPPVQPVPQAATPAAVGAGGRLTFSPAQEERVRYVLMSHNVMQTEAPDFPLQLGGVVPETVRLSPLPIEVSDVVPNYRAYAYVISQNRIVIVTADRRTISSVIPIEARG